VNPLSDFEEQYDELYAKQYGKYRIIRIKEAVEKLLECGDYSKGIARIKCTNHNCDNVRHGLSLKSTRLIIVGQNLTNGGI